MYQEQLNRILNDISLFDKQKDFKKLIETNLHIMKQLREEFLGRKNSTLFKIKDEIYDLKNEVETVNILIKNIFNKNLIDFPNLSFKSSRDHSIYLILEILKKSKLNNKNKEITINMLQRVKDTIDKNLQEKENFFKKEFEDYELSENFMNSIVTDLNKKLIFLNSLNSSSYEETSLSIKNLLKFHSQSFFLSKKEFSELKIWWETESITLFDADKNLINSIRSLNKIRSILINNYDELRRYLNTKS
jgi:hypothetical protein